MKKMIRASLCLVALLMPLSKGMCSADIDEEAAYVYRVAPTDTRSRAELDELKAECGCSSSPSRIAISNYIQEKSNEIVEVVETTKHKGVVITTMILERLKLYDMQSNIVTQWFTGAFHEALQNNDTITTLNLRGNMLCGSKMKGFTQALAGNKALTALDLGHNSIGDTELGDLKTALTQNKTLTSLILDGNMGLKEINLASFITFLAENCPTLQYLSLREIGFSDDTLTVLAEVLPKSPLLGLNLSWNYPAGFMVVGGADPVGMSQEMKAMLQAAKPESMMLYLDDKSK